MKVVRVHKNRTNTLMVSLGYDVSQDTILSDIRVDPNHESELIARWMVSWKNDGRDGELLLTMSETVTSEIPHTMGYMDLKRVSGGESFPIFEHPILVHFQEVVTE